MRAAGSLLTWLTFPRRRAHAAAGAARRAFASMAGAMACGHGAGIQPAIAARGKARFSCRSARRCRPCPAAAAARGRAPGHRFPASGTSRARQNCPTAPARSRSGRRTGGIDGRAGAGSGKARAWRIVRGTAPQPGAERAQVNSLKDGGGARRQTERGRQSLACMILPNRIVGHLSSCGAIFGPAGPTALRARLRVATMPGPQ